MLLFGHLCIYMYCYLCKYHIYKGGVVAEKHATAFSEYMNKDKNIKRLPVLVKGLTPELIIKRLCWLEFEMAL